MSVQIPDVNSHITPEANIVSPSEHVSHGGGCSYPGMCVSPPRAEAASAQTSARESRNFLTIDSPMVEVVELGGYAAKTSHDNSLRDPALIHFRLLADRKDFRTLLEFCFDRLAVAADAPSTLRWKKDASIAFSLQARYVDALGLLRSADYLVAGVEGVPLGKYENEFGIVLARLGRSSHALDHFNRAYQQFRRAGELTACAGVDHNRAHALVTRGETAKAMQYIQRALDHARATNDYRLEKEICESLLEFKVGARP